MNKKTFRLFVALMLFVSPVLQPTFSEAPKAQASSLFEQGTPQVTEAFLQSLFAEYNITAATLKYDQDKNRVVLNDVSVALSFFPSAKLHFQEIAFWGFNPQAFNPITEGRPLIADKVILKKMTASYTLSHVVEKAKQEGEKDVTVNLSQTMFFSNIVIDDWRQNLGKLLVLGKKAYDEAFFTALLDNTIDKIVYTSHEVKTETEVAGQKNTSVAKAKKMTIEDVSSKEIRSITINGMYSATTDADGITTESTTDKMVWNSVKSLSPSLFAFMVEYIPQVIAQDPNDPAFIMNIFNEDHKTKLTAYSKDLIKLFLNTQMSFEGLNIKISQTGKELVAVDLDGVDYVSYADFENKSKITIATALQGLKLDFEQLGLSSTEQAMISPYLGKGFIVDTAFNIELVNKQNASNLGFALGAQNVAMNDVDINLILPDAVLAKAFELLESNSYNVSMADVMAWLPETSLVNAENTLDDKGLLPIVLSIMSKETAQPLDASLQMILGQVKQMLPMIIPNFGDENTAAVEQCINTPGTLKISTGLAAPTKVEEVAMFAMTGQFEKLQLKAICTPGKTSIIDAANALAAKASPEATAPEATAPDATTPEATAPEATAPEATAPEATAPEATAPEAAAPEAITPEAVTPENPQSAEPVVASQTEGEKVADAKPSDTVNMVTAPVPQKPGKALIMPTTEDTMSLSAFAPDQKADSCVQVIAFGKSPLIAIRLESFGGKLASWKTKDVKLNAQGLLKVQQGDTVVNPNDASFSLDVSAETPLNLYLQDNGALADPNTPLRVIFFHKDGSRVYSIIQR